eukprot:TRINITY_DN1300_c1_g2_i1.p1 TRINITY_DN1300_c1_g2~~TRINITY_DN1300_c1_g2_i1.p1  ORF type:complete len:435 (+),score=48.67 TRINITY_DN1300_c1_g2_i1:150-1454(+)
MRKKEIKEHSSFQSRHRPLFPTKPLEMSKPPPVRYVVVNGLRYVVPYMSCQTYSVKGDHDGKAITQVLGETFRLQRGTQDIEESKRHWQGEVNGKRIALKRRKTHKEDTGPFTADFEEVLEEELAVKEQDKIRMNKHVHERVVTGSTPTLIEDTGDFVIINKPAGIPCVDSQGGFNNIIDISIHELRPHLRPGLSLKLHPVHRLDAPVSGVLILARGGKHVRSAMNDLRERLAKKWYLVQVEGSFPDTTKSLVYCDYKIGWDSKLNKAICYNDPDSVKETDAVKSAKTSFKKIKDLDNGTSLLIASPETGHRHQIRVHLSSLGYPIIGDVLYGSKPLTCDSAPVDLYRDSSEQELRQVLKETFQDWCPKCHWVQKVLDGDNILPVPQLEPEIHLHALRYIIPSVGICATSSLPHWAAAHASSSKDILSHWEGSG